MVYVPIQGNGWWARGLVYALSVLVAPLTGGKGTRVGPFSVGGAIEWWQGIADPRSKVVSFPNQGIGYVGAHCAQDNRPGELELQPLLSLSYSKGTSLHGRPQIIMAQLCHHIPSTTTLIR